MLHRELSHLKTWKVTDKWGPRDNPTVVNTVLSKEKERNSFVQILCTAEWDERTIIGGLTLNAGLMGPQTQWGPWH